MENITIRPYKHADENACMDIFHSNGVAFFAHQEEHLFRRWLVRVPALEAAWYFVIEQEDKIIACGGFVIDREMERATLAWGMVHKDFHKKGLGLKLLLFRIEEIKKLLPVGKVLALDTTQRTFTFFEKLGFKTIRIRKDYYSDGLDRYDMEMLLM